MVKATVSDNMVKLRELTSKISDKIDNEKVYKDMVKKLKNIIGVGKIKVESSKMINDKIKTYENMLLTITSILDEVNFS